MLYITEYLIIHLRCLTSVLNSNNKCYVIYNSRYIHSNVIKYLHTVNGYLYLYLYPGDKKGKPFLIRDISNSQDTVQLLYLPPYLLTYKNTSTLKFTPIKKTFPCNKHLSLPPSWTSFPTEVPQTCDLSLHCTSLVYSPVLFSRGKTPQSILSHFNQKYCRSLLPLTCTALPIAGL